MIRRFAITICAFALLALFVLPVSAREIKVRGVLGRTVEAGGWVILATKGAKKTKYLLLNPQRFQSESWFRVGSEVEATGEIKSDVLTIYQEGVPFEARTMQLRSERRTRRRFASSQQGIDNLALNHVAACPRYRAKAQSRGE